MKIKLNFYSIFVEYFDKHVEIEFKDTSILVSRVIDALMEQYGEDKRQLIIKDGELQLVMFADGKTLKPSDTLQGDLTIEIFSIISGG